MSDLICCVQARMGSTRLPGKSLMEILPGMPLIEMVLRRCLAARLPEKVVLCTSSDEACAPMAELAHNLGAEVVRGSENNVLSRFVEAVNRYAPRHVVRVCADNPLVDPGLMDMIAESTMRAGAVYGRFEGLLDGLGCEIVSASALKAAMQDATPEVREHVTAFVDCEDGDACHLPHAPACLANSVDRLDIDTEADMERMRTFIAALPQEEAPLWSAEIIAAALQR